jgi:hypothetical protein
VSWHCNLAKNISMDNNRDSWMYLRLILTHLGFFISFINWIMNYVTYMSFSLLINGTTSYFYRPRRGLRKGCPLSPLVFIILVEVLRRALFATKSYRNLKGVDNGGSLFLCHFLFVADILIFFLLISISQQRDVP